MLLFIHFTSLHERLAPSQPPLKGARIGFPRLRGFSQFLENICTTPLHVTRPLARPPGPLPPSHQELHPANGDDCVYHHPGVKLVPSPAPLCLPEPDVGAFRGREVGHQHPPAGRWITVVLFIGWVMGTWILTSWPGGPERASLTPGRTTAAGRGTWARRPRLNKRNFSQSTFSPLLPAQGLPIALSSEQFSVEEKRLVLWLLKK